MTTHEQIKSSQKTPTGFQQNVDKFLLFFPCVITLNSIVKVFGLYHLLDFGDSGEIFVTKVKFFDAYVTGYKVTIVLLDIKNGEIIKRCHRLNNDALPCDWVITDLYVKDEEIVKNYCENK